MTVLSIEKASKAHQGTHTFMVDFGVSIEPPKDYYFELIPRSSLAWTGFVMPNSVGVIDPDYRGSLKNATLVYLGPSQQADTQAESLVGRRLAQLVLRPLISSKFTEVKAEETCLQLVEENKVLGVVVSKGRYHHSAGFLFKT